MASIRTKFTVGLFVTLGTILAIIAIIGVGMSTFLKGGDTHLAYFDESVQGLDKDSEVFYRGVTVGRVTDITIAPNATLIQTTLQIETDLKSTDDIYAQLKSAGITGKMYVELNRIKSDSERKGLTKPPFATDDPFFPTKPSDIKQLLDNLTALDIQGISDRAKTTLDNFNETLAEADIKAISQGIQRSLVKIENMLDEIRWAQTIESIESAADSIDVAAGSFNDLSNDTRMAVNRIDALIAGSESDLRQAISELKHVVENVGHLVQGADSTVEMLGRDLELTLQNVEEASGHLNRSLELIADQPSQLVFGEPPLPRELPPE